MIESAHISTSSTGGEESPMELISNPQKNSEPKSQCPKNFQSKRFKNLIECYPCVVDDCQILFESQVELDAHKSEHKKLYKCKYPGCEKTFMQSINLQKHIKSHRKNKKLFFCPFEGCNKSFSASYSVTLHYRIHTGTMPFKCDICGKKFFDKANWQYHTNNMHKQKNMKKLICQHKNCGHKSKSEKQLLMHHDKLEVECIKEKNLLLKLIMLYQNASIDLLANKENIFDNEIKVEKNIGNYDDKNSIWINYINNYNLDDDLKNYVNLIKMQSENVINNSIDNDKYKNILDN